MYPNRHPIESYCYHVNSGSSFTYEKSRDLITVVLTSVRLDVNIRLIVL